MQVAKVTLDVAVKFLMAGNAAQVHEAMYHLVVRQSPAQSQMWTLRSLPKRHHSPCAAPPAMRRESVRHP
jgi:hypothetical protein